MGRLPANPDFVRLAPILCAGVTTYKAIKETEAKPGERLAISGIGGLGHIAIQYAKARGFHVAAVDISDEKLALARKVGADVMVDGRAGDAAAQLPPRDGRWRAWRRCGPQFRRLPSGRRWGSCAAAVP